MEKIAARLHITYRFRDLPDEIQMACAKLLLRAAGAFFLALLSIPAFRDYKVTLIILLATALLLANALQRILDFLAGRYFFLEGTVTDKQQSKRIFYLLVLYDGTYYAVTVRNADYKKSSIGNHVRIYVKTGNSFQMNFENSAIKYPDYVFPLKKAKTADTAENT